MSPKIELLAPGGDIDAIKAAIIAGADAVYCGLDTFNARNRAANISFDELVGIIRLAHEYQCQIFLTLNIIILEREFKTLAKLLSKLVNTTLDGVIVQDLGMLYILNKHFPTLDIHASTQLTTHNIGQIPFLKKLGASRANLSRELNLKEISAITAVSQKEEVLTEVFVHGSLCVAFSGLCYSTSASVGNSGNRGRCSQACREEYKPTESGNKFPLNIKDNSAFFDLPALIDAGVHSFKVEGRIKGASYVHTVIDSFRKQIDGFVETGELLEDGERLYKVFNRDFSNAFLRGDLNQSMFIENPRDNSKYHAIDKSNAISVVQIQDVEQSLNDEKEAIHADVFDKIKYLSIEKRELSLVFSGEVGEPLTVTIKINEVIKQGITETRVQEQVHVMHSERALVASEKNCIDHSAIEKRFKSFNNAEFNLTELSTDNIPENVTIPFKELSTLKNKIATLLSDGVPVLPEVELPKLIRHAKKDDGAKLSLLICDENDINLGDVTDADIYFKLPDAYKRGCTKYVSFFQENPRLIPWFPSVLIGK
ncbi:MAG: peptidase U32 family protein, partial [Colwellia sp.]